MMAFNSWHSYPSTFALGHRALADLLLDPVLVEEKVDGSQFSFGLFHEADGNLRLRARSKGAEIQLLAPEKMFAMAVEVIRGLPLREEWTYRAEYLTKPKHNALTYDRIPRQHLILFDVNSGHEEYLGYDAKAEEADRLGLEVVPRIYEGRLNGIDQFRAWLEHVSILGGQKIEGLVVKNYRRFGPDKKILIGKFVSEAFKEVHAAEWKAANPGAADIIETIIRQYRSPARWAKAVQHLREAGQLDGSPRDIGLFFKEVPDDIKREAEEDIRSALWSWAWAKIRRGVCHGLAEWYKEELLKAQFPERGQE